jgi:hypothetical protein
MSILTESVRHCIVRTKETPCPETTIKLNPVTGGKMRYLALIYGNEAASEGATQEQQAAMLEAYNVFGQKAGARGVLLGGDALMPTSSATTVRVREGKAIVTDGPFAETKEQLGGYYLLNCQNLDEAIEVASQIPGALTGSIEIRPIMEFN